MIAESPITILKELQEFIIPLSGEEFKRLEANILSEGCRDPLSVWKKGKNQLILIDGHNRYKICEKYGIPFKTKVFSFDGIDEVKVWMVDNQMGRRNLTPDQLSYYRGVKYLSLKKKKGGYDKVQAKGQSETSTSEFLSAHFNVSESTVKRDAKFAEGLDIINRSNPKLKRKILSGEVNVKKGDIQLLASAPNASDIVIKNEADLYNKAKRIKEDLYKDISSDIGKIERLTKAQAILKEAEPAFLSKEDAFRTIKGRIVSAVNKAIQEKDVTAISDLKKLVDRLGDLISD